MVSFLLPPMCLLAEVQVVVRWRNGHASHRELAALRELMPELRDRPASEVFREARQTTEWVVVTCYGGEAQRRRDDAERLGLVAVIEPVVKPDVVIVPDAEVLEGLSRGGLSVSDYFLVGGLVCHLNGRGELMTRIIDDGALSTATTAYLLRHGAGRYASRADFEARNGPLARAGGIA